MRYLSLLTMIGLFSAAFLIAQEKGTPKKDAPKTEAPQPAADAGVRPVGADGKPLNLDFETGTLEHWQAEGNAFKGQPIKGDTVSPRRGDMKSDHTGQYWIGTYENSDGDRPQGTLTSAAFKVTHPWASLRIAGGPHRETCVELVRGDDQSVFFRASGHETENLEPVAVDLQAVVGKQIFIRLVDKHSAHWGHVNFDDFRFHEKKPVFPGRPAPLAADVYQHNGLSPTEAAAAMTLPKGFQAKLFAGEPDVQQPIALALDDRGRVWVAEAYSYPVRVPEKAARDRILIFEDADGDGKFDKRTVFTDKLNLVSGLELGFGGVWVGAAPHLLFIPDRDGDDKPDGPPEILLDGWGHQDTHETLNSLIWGPDGWLYGCHGVFTHSRVGKPGTPDNARQPINAGIWRYHPIRHEFEVFAHGTSNPWGVDFNDRGQAFLTSCVIPHLYHVIQGARYERQAGAHFNPHTYDDIKTIADHRHYVGGNPHGGNSRSDSAGGGHAHSGAMIYLGGAWPAEYRDTIFMNNIHGQRINRDLLAAKGSGYVGGHGPDFLLSNDRWSQILNLRYGPDGNVYLIDWYDKQACHTGNVDAHDRSNGRIFKISYAAPKGTGREVGPASRAGLDAGTARHAAPTKDLKKLGDADLVQLQLEANDWYARHARRILQERWGWNAPNRTYSNSLTSLRSHPDDTRRLRGLWTMHVTRGLSPATIQKALSDDSPYVRGWAIQLATEQQLVKNDAESWTPLLKRFAELAKSDASPVVRMYLASAAGRLPLDQRWDILAGLCAHPEDAGDHNLPLLIWYAAEPLAQQDMGRALQMAVDCPIAPLLAFTVRRIASLGTPESIAILIDELGKTGRVEGQRTLLQGVNTALKGQRQVAMPKGWPAVSQKLAVSPDPLVRSQVTALAVTFGDPSALGAMREIIKNRAAELTLRQAALASLLGAKDANLAPILHDLIGDEALRGAALRGLAAYDDPRTPEVILSAYASFAPDAKRDALGTLTARASSARLLLTAIGAKRVPAGDLTADMVRQLQNLKQPEIDKQIGEVWGVVRETAQDKAKLLAEFKTMLLGPHPQPPDLEHGRAVFAKTCQQCHTLFGAGGKVGPELTGSNRANLDYLLSNIVDPSAVLAKEYIPAVIATTDGRIVTGLVRAEDKNSVTVQTANELVVIPRGEIDELSPGTKSMMPDDLLKPLKPQEVRALVAYMGSPAQVPMLATVDNLKLLFNGRDLAGWDGDPALWSVENGEIVGRTAGLKRNEFLRSHLAAADFHFSVEVKLVKNEGNSGIQFRSTALPEGEVKGYQADVGVGWWGKLYEEHGRGLLWKDSGEAHVKTGEWNRYEIIAVGGHVKTLINGQVCVDLEDPPGAKRGILAFQLHSGGATEVRFRDLKLELK